MSGGKIIDFESSAIGRLRAKLAAADEANADLVAYARGQSGAVAQIHMAALAAMDAEGLEHLVHIVTQDWVDMLAVDAVALTLDMPEDQGPEVLLRAVPRGADLFGPAADLIRSEALIRLDHGLLALGARDARFAGGQGSELLAFLGAVVSRMIARWTPAKP